MAEATIDFGPAGTMTGQITGRESFFPSNGGSQFTTYDDVAFTGRFDDGRTDSLSGDVSGGLATTSSGGTASGTFNALLGGSAGIDLGMTYGITYDQSGDSFDQVGAGIVLFERDGTP